MAGLSQTESAEEPFRVRVSLERFFAAGDPRARCYVSVMKSRRVRWLARRLRHLFPLPRRLALLSRGHLLPPDEPLALLRSDDPVEVIPATVEFDQIFEDNHMGTKGSLEASTPEPVEPLPNCKKRKKYRQELSWDDSKQIPCEAINTITGYNAVTQESIEFSQECEPPRVSIDYETGQSSEYLLCNGSNPQHFKTQNITMPQLVSTQRIERDHTELPEKSDLSDSEKMRLLKEQALAVLDQVAARPRRRVRVRRRRKRAPEPQPPALDERPVHLASHTVSVSDPTPPVGIPSVEISDFPRRGDDSTGEDMVDAPDLISISSQQIDVNVEGGCAPQPMCSTRVALVLRNTVAAPRVARLVHSLVDVAPL